MQVSAAMVQAFILSASFKDAQRALVISRTEYDAVRAGTLRVLDTEDGPALVGPPEPVVYRSDYTGELRWAIRHKDAHSATGYRYTDDAAPRAR